MNCSLLAHLEKRGVMVSWNLDQVRELADTMHQHLFEAPVTQDYADSYALYNKVYQQATNADKALTDREQTDILLLNAFQASMLAIASTNSISKRANQCLNDSLKGGRNAVNALLKSKELAIAGHPLEAQRQFEVWCNYYKIARSYVDKFFIATSDLEPHDPFVKIFARYASV